MLYRSMHSRNVASTKLEYYISLIPYGFLFLSWITELVSEEEKDINNPTAMDNATESIYVDIEIK